MNDFTIKKLKKYAFCIIAVFGIQQAFGQCPTIVWQDEFDGTTLDLTKWNYQIGDGCSQNLCGWGNNELQSYQENNVVVSNGTLKITAKKERIKGTQYTSGRINSKQKGDFTYGRFEASIKLPAGDGLWPAFWMLPTDEYYGTWPESGEIDIMEYVASTPNEILGYIHYGDPYPNNQSQGNTIQLNDAFYNAFHEFAIEWEPGEIRWFMDGILYSRKTPEDISPYNWPFDKDFHFLLNVAVGGNLGGEVIDSMLPATMEVDYVRVYNGFKPYLEGESIVSNQESGVQYSLGNLASTVDVTWSVPAGASIVSGQGSNTISVDFGVESGLVSASFDDGCTAKSLTLNVEVEPPYIKSFSFENFDDPSTITFVSSTGTLTEVSNPAANTINSSAVSGKYVRDGQSQYDLIRYSVSDITDASLYVMKDKKFYMDVYSGNAPVGTEIILQLETADATASNFPVGRHSRYIASIKENNSWHRLEFNLLDRPDPAASNSAVETMYLLFNPNTFTSQTYYYDNLDSYNADYGTGSNQNPSISISQPTEGESFPGGSTISIIADAIDEDGTINMVEFFINGSSIGLDDSHPYSIDWQVPQGTWQITAVATDNNSAATTSESVTITGTGGDSPTSMYVSSIITGTVDAGKGSKYGVATVTILNDLGQPTQNATVSGTFSGSFNSQGSAVTNSEGKAIIQTQLSAKGSLVVEFCVTGVVHPTLSYDSNSNVVSCTSGAQKLSLQGEVAKASLPEINGDTSIKFIMAPNPTHNVAQFSTEGMDLIISLEIYDMSGKLMLQKHSVKKTGELDVSNLPKGVYLVKIHDKQNQSKTMKLIKK